MIPGCGSLDDCDCRLVPSSVVLNQRCLVSRSTHALRDLRVECRMKNYASLLFRIRTRADQDRRGTFAAVYGHMEHASRDVEEVARPSHLPMLQALSGPQFHLIATDQVEGGFVRLMNVRLGSS